MLRPLVRMCPLPYSFLSILLHYLICDWNGGYDATGSGTPVPPHSQLSFDTAVSFHIRLRIGGYDGTASETAVPPHSQLFLETAVFSQF